MKKKLVMTLLATMLVSSLCACGNADKTTFSQGKDTGYVDSSNISNVEGNVNIQIEHNTVEETVEETTDTVEQEEIVEETVEDTKPKEDFAKTLKTKADAEKRLLTEISSFNKGTKIKGQGDLTFFAKGVIDGANATQNSEDLCQYILDGSLPPSSIEFLGMSFSQVSDEGTIAPLEITDKQYEEYCEGYQFYAENFGSEDSDVHNILTVYRNFVAEEIKESQETYEQTLLEIQQHEGETVE